MLTQSAAIREGLEQQLQDVTAALEQSQRDRTAEAAAAASQLERREAEFAAALGEADAARSALEQKLTQADAAVRYAEERTSVERLAARQQAEERQAEFDARFNKEVAARQSVEARLAESEAARHDGERRYAAEISMAAEQMAERQAQHDARQTEAAAAREAVEQQLRATLAALEESQQGRAAEAAAAAERLSRRESELGRLLVDADTLRGELEEKLVFAAATLQQNQQRAAVELQVAADEANRRQSTLELKLSEEVAACKSLERDLAETRLTSEEDRRRFVDEAAAMRQRTREHEVRLEERATRERADHERVLAGMQEEVRHLQQERETLQQSLGTTHEQLQLLTVSHKEERENFERSRSASEAELRRLSAEYEQAQQTLDEVRAYVEQTLERVSSERAIERAKLENLITERDVQLREQAATHLAAQQAAKSVLTQVEERLRDAVDSSSREIANLQTELRNVRQELEQTRDQREGYRSQADRLPQLQNQLEDSHKENRRQFERSPYGMCRCGSDGSVKVVNRALVALLGYRNAEELRKADFASTVFESADDLRWLIERSLNTGTTESVETTWMKKDGRRLVVRLAAVATGPESIEIVAEDVTMLRGLEDKLRHAQRMEAVARLASEVAVTCDNLLRDVHQGGQEWLAAIGSDTPLRHQGELLLDEVTRAASFLRQLSVYGKKETSALEPVNVNRVLRDLAPVLKRVAGSDIEFVLPKSSSPVDVDVEAERVERVLVNVASYARERMPFGGRLKVDLGTVMVDRQFVAKYPNVRPGAHALLTITEVKGAERSDWPLREETTEGAVKAPASDKPGVDLGALLALIGECGGHLWMAAEPSGNMVLKIHLPKRASDGTGNPPPPNRAGRGVKSVARWFRH